VDDGGAANTTTSVNIDTGTHENFEIGSVVIIAGNATQIVGKTDGGGSADTLTVLPPLPQAPKDNVLVYGTGMYRRTTDSDFYGVNITWAVDGIRHKFFNCKGNVEFVDGDPLIARFSLSYDHYIREDEDLPVDLVYSDSPALLSIDKTAHLDSTGIDIGGFTGTPGVTVTGRNTTGRYGINGRNGIQLSDQIAGGTFNELVESGGSLTAEDLWLRQTEKNLFIHWGSHENTFCIASPETRLVDEPHPQDQEGLVATPYVWQSHDAGTYDDPTDGNTKFPDFSVHIA